MDRRQLITKVADPICFVCTAAVMLNVAILMWAMDSGWEIAIALLFGLAAFLTGTVLGKKRGD